MTAPLLRTALRDTRDRVAVATALTGGLLAAAGSTMTWYTIAVGGIAGPGGSATGLEGRDGRTVLAAAVVALAGVVLIAMGRRRTVGKVALVAAGAVTAIVAVAAIVDASSKDEEVEDEFGIPADRVVAEVGSGLWLVGGAGIALLAAGAAVEPQA